MASKTSSRGRADLVATTNAGYTCGMKSEWLLLYPAGNVRSWLELTATTVNFRGRFRYRTAAVTTRRPDAWTDAGTVQSGDGQWVEDFNIASATAGKLWIQFAVGVATPLSGQFGEAFARMQGYLDGHAALLVAATVQVEPDVNAGQNSVVPLGQPFRAFGLGGVMAGFIVNGLAGSVVYDMVIRYYDGDSLTPGAWIALPSASWTITADEVRNSGDQAVTPGTKTRAQLGLKIGAGTNPRATISVVAAGRYT